MGLFSSATKYNIILLNKKRLNTQAFLYTFLRFHILSTTNLKIVER
ncbi:hypothetical protein SAMN05428977_10532 [Nitrosomonas sp. Nm166]|nr:hypothetical protein SAMN05428977_10532 [Nitrosomonas sp. Nm166]